MANNQGNVVAALPRHERILNVLEHLGIVKAHFAARVPSDIVGLIGSQTETVASLTMICPESLDRNTFSEIAGRLLIVSGDSSPTDHRIIDTARRLPDAQHVALEGYKSLVWSNVTLDREKVLAPLMLDFIERTTSVITEPRPTESEGEVANISFAISGSGPPLVLLPLALTPSQWDPLLPILEEHFTTIVLGGPELGVIPPLEDRGRAPGYLRLVSNMMDEIGIKNGDRILDIGCGTGVIDRWLARMTEQNSITALDLNGYLIREAQRLARHEGLDDRIDFRQGNAEELAISDGEFDVTISMTVMEEVNADRMFSEMVRVTKPGGRVGVIVRALDIPKWLNAPIAPNLKSKIEQPGEWDEGDGCASASLYDRFLRSGLTNIKKFPDLTAFDNPRGSIEFLLQMILTGALDEKERQEWRKGFEVASRSGIMIMTWPHHCAVGAKPS